MGSIRCFRVGGEGFVDMTGMGGEVEVLSPSLRGVLTELSVLSSLVWENVQLLPFRQPLIVLKNRHIFWGFPNAGLVFFRLGGEGDFSQLGGVVGSVSILMSAGMGSVKGF